MNTQATHGSAKMQDSIRIGSSPIGIGLRLKASRFLPHPRDREFDLVSDAIQLEARTPSWLRFSVLMPPPIRVATGVIIDYRLRVRGLPLRWQSRIGEWEPPLRFVDEQTRGPCRRWHHQHIFDIVDGGTLCRDSVDYAVYGGSLINSLFVRPDLFKIFAFRQSKLRELFPTPGASPPTFAAQANRQS